AISFLLICWFFASSSLLSFRRIFFCFSLLPSPPISTLFPYTTLFRSHCPQRRRTEVDLWSILMPLRIRELLRTRMSALRCTDTRSEEHTSELQSRVDLVCRLLLEKKKQQHDEGTTYHHS